jgi:hypothetical protein
MNPPFKNKDRILCIQDSPDITLRGEIIDTCRCIKGHTYDVGFMVYNPDFGWIIATILKIDDYEHYELHDAKCFATQEIVRGYRQEPLIQDDDCQIDPEIFKQVLEGFYKC